ncbi:MAG: hypothetical protein WC071_05315 [Victivallaceae bacterium]
MQELKAVFESLEQLFESCNIDYNALKAQCLSKEWFDNYENQRIVNSFLFNYIKIQDKIGAKIFKMSLFELKEINDWSIPMIDILHTLEKLGIIDSIDEWDKLRELRNVLAHEYPADIEDRIENIALALDGFEKLKNQFLKIKKYCASKNILL